MNHKHIQVIVEDHDFCGEYDTWDVINDLIDYVEAVQMGDVNSHYKRCIANKYAPLPETATLSGFDGDLDGMEVRIVS